MNAKTYILRDQEIGKQFVVTAETVTVKPSRRRPNPKPLVVIRREDDSSFEYWVTPELAAKILTPIS